MSNHSNRDLTATDGQAHRLAGIRQPARRVSTITVRAPELLELCAELLRQASPTVHTELRQFFTQHGHHHGGLGWFCDALDFTTLLNRTTLGRQPRRRVTVSGEYRWTTCCRRC